MPQLLLELFSEEIPARMQSGAARDLERMASERLKAAGLSWDALTTYAGPRRLTLVVEGLPAATPDRSEEMKGPRANAPEQALEGFLRKTGLTRDQLTERDGVLFAVIDQKGVQTTAVIAEAVDQIVRAFPWPKSMRWGSGTLRWVRPLKRIVALFDGTVVPFEMDGIQSGDVTEGHRFMGTGRPFSVRDFADYKAKLETEFVVLDAANRKAKILETARAACHGRGLELVDDDGLLDEVAGLAEWPTPILGDMDPQFLDLPPEVVRLSMKVHQKYFAVRRSADLQVRQTATAGGADLEVRAPLAPHFLVVANVEASDGGVALAAGNSRVLSARLNDARFFWDEDRKVGFDVWRDKLKGVTFHAKLGTMAERVDRIAALAREIAPLVGADPDQAETAARLAKADLASAMVGEFPELQGVMGGHYARALSSPFPLEGGRAGVGGVGPVPTGSPQGSAPTSADDRVNASGRTQNASTPTQPSPLQGEGSWDAVADAIRDHYKPQGPADSVPTAPLTVAVALADKLDTLVGFWVADELPSGSKDPYALRRATLGTIRLMLENDVRVRVREVVFSWYAALVNSLPPYQALEAWHGDALIRFSARPTDERFKDLWGEFLDLLRLGDARVVSIENEWSVTHASYPQDERNRRPTVRETQAYRLVAFDLLAFFADRLKVLLRDQGKRHDLVDAVFALGDDDLVRIVRRVEALDAFLATDDGANLLAGYKRASNILKAEEKKGPVPTGMVATGLSGQPEAETTLAFATEAARTAVDTALETEDFAAAMTALSRLRAPVDAFFTDVMVNSDVPAERDNRLKLLGQVRDVMGRVADFGQVAG